jgi:hypothetical protein
MEAVIKMPVRSSRKSLQLGQALASVFSRSFGSSKLCQGAQPYVLFRTSSSLGFFERQSELSELISLSWLDLSLLIVGCEPLSETKQKGDTGITDLYRLTLVPKSPKRLCRNAAFGNMPNISQHALFLMHCMKYHTTIHNTTILDQRPARTKFAFLQRWCQIKQPPAREAGEACSAAVW